MTNTKNRGRYFKFAWCRERIRSDTPNKGVIYCKSTVPVLCMHLIMKTNIFQLAWPRSIHCPCMWPSTSWTRNPFCIFDPRMVVIGPQLFKADQITNLTKLEYSHVNFMYTPYTLLCTKFAVAIYHIAFQATGIKT